MRRLWIAFVAVVLASFAVLGWVGTRIYLQAPPIPDRVVTTDGRVVIPPSDIQRGQNVWQALGGMELGSVWGHGSYVAPDWSADWLHRESVYILQEWARTQTGSSYESLSAGPRADLEARLATLMRTNTFDPASGDLVVDPVRARAFESNAAHYADVFAHGRDDYAIPVGAQPDPAKLRQLAAFFFWSSWAASTNRPGDTVSYTRRAWKRPRIGCAFPGSAAAFVARRSPESRSGRTRTS
jgi:nitric oxide reductase subunit B